MLRLNFCVRDGNRWVPQAIVTGNSRGECLLLPPFWYRRFGQTTASRLPPLLRRIRSFRTLKTAQAQDLAFSDQDSTASLLETSLLSHKPLAPGFSGSRSHRISFAHSFPRALPVPCSLFPSFQDQALDRLVSSSSIRYRTFTDDLSTLSSSRGLTCFKQWQFYSPGGLHA